MSNEISLSGSLRFVKEAANESLDYKCKADFEGTKFIKYIAAVGTTEEAIDLGDIGTPGYMMVINRDPTNFVSIRSGTGAANLIKVRPGKFALFEIASAAPFIIADTESCHVEFLIIEA